MNHRQDARRHIEEEDGRGRYHTRHYAAHDQNRCVFRKVEH